MNFTRPWTAFALDAEYDHYGATRIVKAHNDERTRREAAEALLRELRIRMHGSGRRPEECWEMSEIDGHLAQ